MTGATDHPAARAAREAREHAQKFRAIFDPDNSMSRELETLAFHIEGLLREREKLRDTLEIADSWISRWAPHVAHCVGGPECTCEKTAVLSMTRAALEQEDEG